MRRNVSMPPAILRSGQCRHAVQPALEVHPAQAFAYRQSGFCLVDLSCTDEAHREILLASAAMSGMSFDARNAQAMPSAYRFATKLA